MNKVTKNVVVAISLGLLSASVLAAGHGETQGQGKNRTDAPMFQVIDANSDGAITSEEFQAFHQQRVEERSKAGYKMKNMGQHDFASIDTNSDGTVDTDEFAAHQQAMMEKNSRQDAKGQGKQAMAKDGKGDKGAKGKGGKGNQVHRDGRQLFKLADTNNDGLVDQAEYMALAEQRFTKLDTNGDGTIDTTEFQGGMQYRGMNKNK